jgi:hypothetical protein
MICYRAETAVAHLIAPHYSRADDEVRSLIKAITLLSIDLMPDYVNNKLNIYLYQSANIGILSAGDLQQCCKSGSCQRETCSNAASRDLVSGRLAALLQVGILSAGDLQQCCKSESCQRETCSIAASRNLVSGRLAALLQVGILSAGDLQQCYKSESCQRETCGNAVGVLS